MFPLLQSNHHWREGEKAFCSSGFSIDICMSTITFRSPPNRFFSCIVIIAWLWKSSQLFKSLDEMIFLPTSSSQTPFKSYGWELRHKRSARPQREGESVARRPGVCSTPSARGRLEPYSSCLSEHTASGTVGKAGRASPQGKMSLC